MKLLYRLKIWLIGTWSQRMTVLAKDMLAWEFEWLFLGPIADQEIARLNRILNWLERRK